MASWHRKKSKSILRNHNKVRTRKFHECHDATMPRQLLQLFFFSNNKYNNFYYPAMHGIELYRRESMRRRR